MRSIVILISGSGSNMAAIVDAAQRDHWPERLDARISAVISNRADAGGLVLARERGIATEVVPHQDHAQATDPRSSFELALCARLDAYQPDLVVLAGFMRVLTPAFVRRYDGRLMNIHPSLLPAFPGLHTHERALRAGCRVAGATVHLVTEELDGGPILAQAVVPVLPGDTPSQLAARVLTQEHRLYPDTIARWLAARVAP